MFKPKHWESGQNGSNPNFPLECINYLDWLLLLMRFEDEMEKKWQTLLNGLNRLIGFFKVFVTSWSEWIENCTGWMSKCISGNSGKAETRWIGTSLSIWFLTFVLSISVVHVIEWCLWVILIDLECLKWKWTTSHSLPISSSSCSSWHFHRVWNGFAEGQEMGHIHPLDN